MRKITVTGLVALAAVLAAGGAATAAGALTSPAGVVTTASAQASGTTATSPAATAAPLARFAAATRPGAAPAAHPLAYPAGVTPAVAPPTDTLQAVSCFSAGDCLAVGSNYAANAGHGSPRSYSWNGSTWTAVPVPLPPGTTGGYLTSVSCKGGACVAVGSYFRGTSEYLLGESWDSNGWALALPGAVSCPSTTFCLVGGEYATADNGYFATVLFHLDGTTWTRATDAALTPTSGGYATYLNSVSCTSSVACVAVGEQTKVPGTVNWHAFAETSNGSKWARFTAGLPASPGSLLDSVSCAVSNYCVAAGGVGPFNDVTTGDAAFSVWNGKGWALHYADPPKGQGSILIGDQCIAGNSCVAVGNEGAYNTNSSHGVTWFWNDGKSTLIRVPVS